MSEKITKENYKIKIKPYQPKKPLLKNGSKAFMVGGIICTVGQVFQNMYIIMFDLTEKVASGLALGTLIFLSALLTGLGVYDKIGQLAGAGSLVTITGFTNAMASAALEYKSEGLIAGSANNMFRIVGSSIVYGVVAAILIGLLRYCINIFFQ